MLVLPGPGLAVGLAMLSLEFPSAQRPLQSALARSAGDERREPRPQDTHEIHETGR